MAIGISTACYYPLELENTVQHINDCNVKVIEVFFNTISEFSVEFIKILKNKCDFYGIKVVSVHPFTSFMEPFLFFSPYEKRYNDGFELYKSFFEYTTMIGADIFNFHGEQQNHYEVEIDKYCEVYHKLFTIAKSFGVCFSQENVSRCLPGKLDFISKMSEKLGNDVYFTLDLKQAHKIGEDPVSFIDSLKNKIIHIHLNDCNKTQDCLLPGTGNYNFFELYKKLNKYKYNGSFIIEVYRQNYDLYDEIQQSVNYINNIFV